MKHAGYWVMNINLTNPFFYQIRTVCYIRHELKNEYTFAYTCDITRVGCSHPDDIDTFVHHKQIGGRATITIRTEHSWVDYRFNEEIRYQCHVGCYAPKEVIYVFTYHLMLLLKATKCIKQWRIWRGRICL